MRAGPSDFVPWLGYRPGRSGASPYPYGLGNLDITQPDQVGGADITHLRPHRGVAYRVAARDGFTRRVWAWELSNTRDATFGGAALKQALASGRRPAIFHADPGAQWTSEAFTEVLTDAGIAIRLDGGAVQSTPSGSNGCGGR